VVATIVIMETAPNPIRLELREIVTQIKRLAGEIRLQIHLGTLELKKAWDELEPKLAEADLLAEKSSEEAYQAVRDMLRKLKHIHGQLPKKPAAT
jgi:hypothetical protein